MGSPRLHDVITAARQTDDDATPIVVFDPDSTLFRTGARHLRILQEFAGATRSRHGRPWDRLRTIIPELDADDFGYEVTDPLRARKLRDRQLERDLSRYWAERYFTDAYCADDPPAPGAVAYTHAVHDAGALVWYLTGRSEGSMRRGTEEGLARHEFPLGDRTRVELRTAEHRGDKGFKVIAGRRISRHGTVVGQFENEPANANALLPVFPDAIHFLVGDVHSAAPDRPDPALITTEDFVLP